MEGLWEFATSTTSQVVATLVIAGLGYLIWRNVDAYRQLCREACTALTTYAPFTTNLSLELPEKGRVAREAAERDLRKIADSLTNADSPPKWLTSLLGLPPLADVRGSRQDNPPPIEQPVPATQSAAGRSVCE